MLSFWQGLILTPLLLQGWMLNLATFWNTVAWTLSCEIMLYAAFPYLIRIPLPKRPVHLVGLVLALWIIGLVPHTLYVWLNPDQLRAPADCSNGETQQLKQCMNRFTANSPSGRSGGRSFQ